MPLLNLFDSVAGNCSEVSGGVFPGKVARKISHPAPDRTRRHRCDKNPLNRSRVDAPSLQAQPLRWPPDRDNDPSAFARAPDVPGDPNGSCLPPFPATFVRQVEIRWLATPTVPTFVVVRFQLFMIFNATASRWSTW